VSEVRVCTVEVAPVHRDPDPASEQVTQVLKGEPLTVEEWRDGWARIRTFYDYPGWVAAEVLAPESDPVEEARSYQKGVLAVSCHMGSYEVASAIWSANLSPVSFFAEELEPRALFEWYRETRARLGISVLTLDLGGIRKVLQALRDQEIVITAVDRDITGTGHLMPFFGRPARIPLGPAAIALRLGTPLLPVCVYRLPDDSYVAEATPLLMPQDTGHPKEDEIRATQLVLRQIEVFIQQRPEQWHVPHGIWEGSP